MPTNREQIRQALAAIAAPFVKTSQAGYWVPEHDELPAVRVYFEDGDTEQGHGDPELSYSDSNATCELEIVMTGSNPDAALDAIAKQISDVVRADVTLGGLVDGCLRVGFDYEREPEALTSSLSVIFNVQYEDED
jgi:hypothetical protein